ncbi:methyltransferase domain-containing protein [Propionivibrio sp.]|uniref:methyltransferase domain-containing protein n=1 Tax=Propionivibrio sp. TaxID=2212460 RepID=UPI00261460D1|nr:methyltransferase domain-containing protein [Propionivibrio sp.]
MSIIKKIKKHGLVRSAKLGLSMIFRNAGRAYNKHRVRNAPTYNNPTAEDFVNIEINLKKLGVKVKDYSPSIQDFIQFQSAGFFPPDYHGGCPIPVWEEKLLEHWVASDRLGLRAYQSEDIYVDIAAGSSPWAMALRQHAGISAFAIDLNEVGERYKDLPYYRTENATATNFSDASVTGASLQCAYEMFAGDNDSKLLKEFARILKPGGKVIILPLYMHTHYCAFSTPEYFGKGHSDPVAIEYACLDWEGIPSARYYDGSALKQRVLDEIDQLGMRYQLLALRNKADLGKNIYCHFILEITK